MMYRKQCKRCSGKYFDANTGQCANPVGGEPAGIINILECGWANDGKGGKDRRFWRTR